MNIDADAYCTNSNTLIQSRNSVVVSAPTSYTVLEEIILPNNFTEYMNGGYANIYYNSNTSTILKIQPLYESSNILASSTLFESIICKIITSLPNTCQIQKCIISNNSVYHYMPYYGKTLHEYVRSASQTSLSSSILPVLLSVTEACIAFYERGLQHTDIKPGNILIHDKTKKITLIDYNICSIRTSGKTTNGWSYGIGTWCYSAPEIALYEEPTDTSMVWSIGLIIAYMYYGHPLNNKYKSIYEYTTQDEWKKIFINLRKRNMVGLPLSKEHKTAMPTRMAYIYSSCTFWDWQKRPSLYELYELLLKVSYNDISYTINHTEISCSINNGKQYKPGNIISHPYIIHTDRKIAFNCIWEICKATKRFDILCKALYLIDLYSSKITKNTISGCIYIAYIMSGSLLTETSFYNEVSKQINISIDELNYSIIETLNVFEWKCYYETADTLVIEHIIKHMKNNTYTYKINLITILYSQYAFYKIIYNIMCNMNTSYTMNKIVELVFKEIIVQNLIPLELKL
jgi:serine/threonine protein kinase